MSEPLGRYLPRPRELCEAAGLVKEEIAGYVREEKIKQLCLLLLAHTRF